LNAIDFHPSHGTFATCGSDGTFCFWDKDNRQRLKAFPQTNYPITAGRFSANGDMFAYAAGYDWSKGHEFNAPSLPRKVLIHKVTEAEVKPKPGTGRRK